MKDEKLKLKLELANIICNEKFNTKKCQKIWKLILKAKKEIFVDIRNKFNSKHQLSSCDYGIMEFELKRLEKKHLGK